MISTAEHLPLEKTCAIPGDLVVYRNAEAERYLASSEVQAAWRELWEQCPWATALQRPEYVCTWYRCYAGRYRPIVVARDGAAGRLDGLMTLAADTESGALVFAGAAQAEYHAWLARTGPQTFITAALNELGRRGFPSLTFKYLPPETPLDWLEGDWRERAILEPVRKPLLDIEDGVEIRESLRKKSNKSRMNRLARHGALEFAELRTPEELDRDYDDIIAFTDFRLGAIHDVCPFAEDPCKRAFYRELLGQPDLLHVTVMRTAGKPIAAHMGLRSRGELILGIICYSPFVAEHSPGKFHLLQLALLLREQGLSALDLTPGSDPYKDRLATRYEAAHVLTIFFDSKELRSERARTRMRGYVRRAAAALPVHPEKLDQYRALAHEVVSNPARAVRGVARRARTQLWSTTEVRLYRLPAALFPVEPGDDDFKRDSVPDLLMYRSNPSMPSRHEFLSSAMATIEAGAHVYTYVRDGRLIQCGWLTPRAGNSFITEVQHAFECPPNSALLWNFHANPSCRRQDLHARALRRILGDVGRDPEIAFAYIAVRADDWTLRRAVEKTGFLYQASILRRIRLNRTQFTRHEGPDPFGKVNDGGPPC